MKRYLLLFVTLLATYGAWANLKFVTDVMVIGGTESEVNALKTTLTAQGWTFINRDLNAGCGNGSDYIYLLYKSDYANSGFVTDVYISTESGTAPDNITYNGRNYTLVPFDGGSRFRQLKGDLNSNAGGDYIHLYITRDAFNNKRAVTNFVFTNVQEGAVGKDGGTTGYDLNSGAGGNYIYMFLEIAGAGWTFQDLPDNQCLITGYNGKLDEITTLIVPYSINGSPVIGFDDTVDFSEFTNLESLFFYPNTAIEEMPSLQGLEKFKHVNTFIGIMDGFYFGDQTPEGIKTLPAGAFAGTAIEKLKMTGVTNVSGGSVGVFEGCDSLNSVTFEKEAAIGENAFANIHSDNCVVVYPGLPIEWGYKKFHHSPNLVVKEKNNNWFTGWCGNTDANNGLYWKYENGVLDISVGDQSYYNNNPQAQVISTHWWEGCGITYPKVKLHGVYSLKKNEFTSTDIVGFYIDPTLKVIAGNAIKDSQNLTHIWFDGTQEQWDAVSKPDEWTTGSFAGKTHWHCTVTFDVNGHGVAPNPQEIEWSNLSKAEDPGAPAVTGYSFTGWYTEPFCLNKWDFENVIPGSMTLYAGWDFVTGDVDGSGKVDGSDLNMLINIILGKLSATDASVKGDPNVDSEGGIDGSDLNFIINILLGN